MTLQRCDDCYAQIDSLDWYGHRSWHLDQREALEQLGHDIESVNENGVTMECDCDDRGDDIDKVREDLDAHLAEHHHCYRCDKLVIEPVYDEGDQRWRPEDQWRVWCSEKCHEDDAEADGVRRAVQFNG
jgi:hypothetical protein